MARLGEKEDAPDATLLACPTAWRFCCERSQPSIRAGDEMFVIDQSWTRHGPNVKTIGRSTVWIIFGI